MVEYVTLSEIREKRRIKYMGENGGINDPVEGANQLLRLGRVLKEGHDIKFSPSDLDFALETRFLEGKCIDCLYPTTELKEVIGKGLTQDTERNLVLWEIDGKNAYAIFLNPKESPPPKRLEVSILNQG